ncbi:hypothetical protein [Bradyrhizobium sp. NBAIM08]|uniref:hypothetical protein n=1 Tax=Bradyrhizobium sp. NBAIM08 TaxID=2793815 RepID=UPI001CD35E04|nr:hypothetical protein [Bradyrhizobium sp. NBAIM08]MCA1480960.1 hypothetical protein [Bradyrhizobium sp. NBAIM08]
MDDMFADGVGEITVINGVARLSLVALEASPGARESGDAKPVPVVKRRLVMPVPGLINLIQQAQSLLARMEQAASAQRLPAEPQKPAVESQKPAAAAAPSSPNF